MGDPATIPPLSPSMFPQAVGQGEVRSRRSRAEGSELPTQSPDPGTRTTRRCQTQE